MEALFKADSKGGRSFHFLLGQTVLAIHHVLISFPGLGFAPSSSNRCLTKEEEEDAGAVMVVMSSIMSSMSTICAANALELDGRWWVKPRSSSFDHYNFLRDIHNRDRWRDMLGVSRSTFDMIRDQLEPVIFKQNTNWREAVSVDCRVAITLYRLVRDATLMEISEKFGIGKSSAFKIVKETVRAINQVFGRSIRWPEGQALQDKVAAGFQAASGLPYCVGAMDTVHVDIIKPSEPGSTDYLNSRQTFSIKMQAVCDSNHTFTDVFVGYPGSVRDSTILRDSGLYEKALRGDVLNASADASSSSTVASLHSFFSDGRGGEQAFDSTARAMDSDDVSNIDDTSMTALLNAVVHESDASSTSSIHATGQALGIVNSIHGIASSVLDTIHAGNASSADMFPLAQYSSPGSRVPPYIVGDSAYPLLPWLMVPYASDVNERDVVLSLPRTQAIFNRKLARARKFITETLAILKKSFPLVGVTVNNRLDFIPELVYACCILHNIRVQFKDVDVAGMLQEIGPTDEDDPTEEPPAPPGEGREGGGDEVRKLLVESLASVPREM